MTRGVLTDYPSQLAFPRVSFSFLKPSLSFYCYRKPARNLLTRRLYTFAAIAIHFKKSTVRGKLTHALPSTASYLSHSSYCKVSLKIIQMKSDLDDLRLRGLMWATSLLNIHSTSGLRGIILKYSDESKGALELMDERVQENRLILQRQRPRLQQQQRNNNKCDKKIRKTMEHNNTNEEDTNESLLLPLTTAAMAGLVVVASRMLAARTKVPITMMMMGPIFDHHRRRHV